MEVLVRPARKPSLVFPRSMDIIGLGFLALLYASEVLFFAYGELRPLAGEEPSAVPLSRHW